MTDDLAALVARTRSSLTEYEPSCAEEAQLCADTLALCAAVEALSVDAARLDYIEHRGHPHGRMVRTVVEFVPDETHGRVTYIIDHNAETERSTLRAAIDSARTPTERTTPE